MPLTFDILSDIQAFIIPTCDDDTVRWAAITARHLLMLSAGEFTVLSRTFSIRLFTSPVLTHVYILLFWHGVSAHSRRSDCAGCAKQKNLALHHRCGIFYKVTTLLFNLSGQRPVSKISLVSFISHLLR